MNYRGDIRRGQTLDFKWDTVGLSGASITRATDGTISVYKDNSTTQSTAGVTDTEDFDGIVGVHHCRIATSADATFYSRGSDFQVVLTGAVIDGVSVNAVIAEFSIENRSDTEDRIVGTVTTDAGNSATAFETDLASTTNDHYKDAFLLITSGTLAGQVKKITAYNGTTKIITVSGGFTGTPADGTTFDIVNGA